MSNGEPNQWTGRTARQIALIVGGCIILGVIAGISTWIIFYFLVNFKDTVPPLAILVAFIGIILALSSVTHSIIGLIIANDNIFCASGEAEGKAKSLHKSFFLQAQIFLAILIVCIMAILMITKIIEVSQGLLIITGAVVFALGQNFVERKNN